MATLEKDLADMLKFGTDAPGTAAPGTDAPGTDAPGTSAPGTDAPGTSAPTTEAPKTSAPSTDAPSTDAPGTAAPTTEAPKDEDKDELELLQEQNEALRKQVEEFAGGPPPKKLTTKTAAPTTEAPLEEVDFLAGADMESITGDSKVLNALLNKVYHAGTRASTEATLRSIPDIVRANAAQHVQLGTATADFYSKNEDLVPFKKTVAAIGTEIVADNPDWAVDKVLEETGKVARERLALYRKVVNTIPTRKAKFAKAPKGKAPSGGKPNLTPVQREIDDMNRATEI